MGLKATTTPQSATANWGTKVGQAGATWSKGLIAAAPTIFNPANIKPQNWVAGVQNPQAAIDYASGMAATNQAQFATVVNGAGQTKFTSSGTTKQAKMLAFQTSFLPKLGNIIQSLNQSNPRGPRGSAQNITRVTAYLQSVAATRGQN
jgi:hypothetical protein